MATAGARARATAAIKLTTVRIGVFKMVGKFVLVRTYSAGVHCGTLAYLDGKNAVLKEARRVWRWRGANTLSELSQQGAEHDWTRISEVVPEILLTEAIEVIPCSEVAELNLKVSRWTT